MCGRAQLVLALVSALSIIHGAPPPPDLKVGSSINIFSHYGLLAGNIKVIGALRSFGNHTDWMFREPTVNAFDGIEKFAHRKQSTKKRVFQGGLELMFCDNKDMLMLAYFQNFSFEKFEHSWKAFAGSWSADVIAKHMGINSSFVHKHNYGYVLVRISRNRDNVELSRMPNNVQIVPEVADEVDKVTVGDADSVNNFIKKYGSHYIHSYLTGNAVYQVFVFLKPTYLQLKARLKPKNLSQISRDYYLNMFSPWQAQHIGTIKVASGNKTVERWAHSNLKINYYIFSYLTLFKLIGDNKTLKVLNEVLQNEAILGMNLKVMLPAFKNPEKKLWFEEILDNRIKLYEVNSHH